MGQLIAPGISALALGVLIAISPAPKFDATRSRLRVELIAADEAAIRTAEAEWSKVVRAKDVDRIVSLYAWDASLIPRDEEEVKGRTEIREGWSRIFAIPGFSQTSRMTRIEVTRVGFMARSHGTYEAVMLDDQKQKVTVRGQRTVLWMRNPAEGWKIAVEMYTDDSWTP